MAEEEPSGVLRLKRMEDPDSFVVVHVYSRGRNALDLELVASEGQSAWGTTIKESEIRKLGASGSQASDAVWVAALRSRLLLENTPADVAEELDGLETVSTIMKDGHMSLIFRRNIGELTQRLGTIDLEPTKDDKFDLWSGCAAGARLTAEARLYANELDRKLAEQTENNSKLEEQLQELLRAKEEHEDALLHKFTELLNAKKLKIRDQQRLLSTAKADIVKAEKAQSVDSRRLESSRSSKRKVTSKAQELPSDEESSDGFESVQDDDEQMKDVSTPEPLEDDETDDDEDEAVPSPPEPKKGIRRNIGSKAKTSEPYTTQPASQSKSSKQGSRKQQQKSEEEAEPPPRRELPFAKRKAAQNAEQNMSQGAPPSQVKSTSTAQAVSGADGDDDDTTDDDEL